MNDKIDHQTDSVNIDFNWYINFRDKLNEKKRQLEVAQNVQLGLGQLNPV